MSTHVYVHARAGEDVHNDSPHAQVDDVMLANTHAGTSTRRVVHLELLHINCTCSESMKYGTGEVINQVFDSVDPGARHKSISGSEGRKKPNKMEIRG